MFCLTWVLAMRRSAIAVWTIAAISGVSQNAWIDTRGTGSICGMAPGRGDGSLGSTACARMVSSPADLADRRNLGLPVGARILCRCARRRSRCSRISTSRGRWRGSREIARIGDLRRERLLGGAAEIGVGIVLPTVGRAARGEVGRPKAALPRHRRLQTLEHQPDRRSAVRAGVGIGADRDVAAQAGAGQRAADLVDRPRVAAAFAGRSENGDPPVAEFAVAFGEGADVGDRLRIERAVGRIDVERGRRLRKDDRIARVVVPGRNRIVGGVIGAAAGERRRRRDEQRRAAERPDGESDEEAATTSGGFPWRWTAWAVVSASVGDETDPAGIAGHAVAGRRKSNRCG